MRRQAVNGVSMSPWYPIPQDVYQGTNHRQTVGPLALGVSNGDQPQPWRTLRTGLMQAAGASPRGSFVRITCDVGAVDGLATDRFHLFCYSVCASWKHLRSCCVETGCYSGKSAQATDSCKRLGLRPVDPSFASRAMYGRLMGWQRNDFICSVILCVGLGNI